MVVLPPLGAFEASRPSKSLRHRHKYRVLKRRRGFGGDASKSRLVPLPQAFRRSDASKGAGEGEAHKMTDQRRYGVIEVRRINADTYHLTINGEMWSEVEWSP